MYVAPIHGQGRGDWTQNTNWIRVFKRFSYQKYELGPYFSFKIFQYDELGGGDSPSLPAYGPEQPSEIYLFSNNQIGAAIENAPQRVL